MSLQWAGPPPKTAGRPGFPHPSGPPASESVPDSPIDRTAAVCAAQGIAAADETLSDCTESPRRRWDRAVSLAADLAAERWPLHTPLHTPLHVRKHAL